MSKGTTHHRRWFCFKLLVAAVAMVTFATISASVSADDGVAPLPDSVTRPVTKLLPDTWTYEIKGSRLVLRPRQQPVFVNLTNSERTGDDESEDEWKRRHIVNIDYQIVLRFEPIISLEEYCALVDHNEGTHLSLQRLEKSPLAIQGKGNISFPSTPAGEKLTQERDQLLQSFRSIPAGHLGTMSVYVEPTYLGYADFFHKEERRIAEALERRIQGELLPYLSAPANAPSAGKE